MGENVASRMLADHLAALFSEGRRDASALMGSLVYSNLPVVLAALRSEPPVSTRHAEPVIPTPEMIAAAWATWHSRHGGKLGPGPAFREAIQAALAPKAAPLPETDTGGNDA